MTGRFRWLSGLGLVAAFAGGCSSSSSGGPAVDAGGPAEEGGSSPEDAAAPIMDAAPSAMCDAVSLTPSPEAGAAACFQCQQTQCASDVAACSTDCTCAPAYSCLEQNSAPGSLNSGYSQCSEAVDALMNGNPALMNLAGCASLNCKSECGFGDGG
jgi:hypothetical protein